jgi:hypothetical protein
MIENGDGAAAITDMWQEDVDQFMLLREPYLIYE